MAEPIFKIVNGKRIEVTGDELVAAQAMWEANAAENEQIQLDMLRSVRNTKLAETDWWELPSQAPMSEERVAYRDALRNITDTYTSLDDVVWPEKP